MTELRLNENRAEDYTHDAYASGEDMPGMRRRGGVRVRFGGMPQTRKGWIATGVLLILCLGVCAGIAVMAKDFLLHDERFVISSSSSILFEGNDHVTRAELLSVFGEDVERNIFRVPLAERRTELEQMPWVVHATVMRLLPGRLRVSVVERTPVAFVREGNHIRLVDANGVLLDMPVETRVNGHYSFPVVTGISAKDPLSTRAARMKIFSRFTSELDASGEKISQGLSEVDLSNPEDVKALIPDHSTDILVHFGDTDFLDRYRRFQAHLTEWRTVYPKLSSVDMRYERQVVLEMQPGSGVPMTSSATNSTTASDGGAVQTPTPSMSAPKPKSATAKAVPAPHGVAAKKTVSVKPHAPVKRHPVVVASPPGGPIYHPPQVVHP